jgi:hypothetical protein
MSQDSNEVKYEFFKNHPADGSSIPRLGRSNRTRLNESFGNSSNPAVQVDYSQRIAERFQSVLDGDSTLPLDASNIPEQPSAAKDLAYGRVVFGFDKVRMDYMDAPEWAEIETGGEGKPASPWVPNPVSPGAGSLNPSDVLPPPDDYGQNPSNTPFVGEGHVLDPSTSSSKISKQSLLKRKSLGASSNV